MNNVLRFVSDFADGVSGAWRKARFEMLVRQYRRKASEVFDLALRVGVTDKGAPWMTAEEMETFQGRTAADCFRSVLRPTPRIVSIRETESHQAWESMPLQQRARVLAMTMGERRIARALGTTRYQVRLWLGRDGVSQAA